MRAGPRRPSAVLVAGPCLADARVAARARPAGTRAPDRPAATTATRTGDRTAAGGRRRHVAARSSSPRPRPSSPPCPPARAPRTSVDPAPSRPSTRIPLYHEGLTTLPAACGSRSPSAPTRRSWPAPTSSTRGVDPRAAVAGPPRPGTATAAPPRASPAGSAPGSPPAPSRRGGPYEDMARAALLDLHALDAPRRRGGRRLVGEVAVRVAARRRRSSPWRWPAPGTSTTPSRSSASSTACSRRTARSRRGTCPTAPGRPTTAACRRTAPGWALWAAGLVLAEIADPDERAAAADAAPARCSQRSTRHAIALVARRRSAARVPRLLGGARGRADPRHGRAAGRGPAAGVGGPRRSPATTRWPGPRSTPRSAPRSPSSARSAPPGSRGTRTGGHADAASAFLLPPFLTTRGARCRGGVAGVGGDHGAARQRPGARRRVARRRRLLDPADVALRVGGGRERRRRRWPTAGSTFLDSHRTPSGSLPEKVLADGSPAAVAPLGWSAACVLLALDALDGP